MSNEHRLDEQNLIQEDVTADIMLMALALTSIKSLYDKGSTTKITFQMFYQQVGEIIAATDAGEPLLLATEIEDYGWRNARLLQTELNKMERLRRAAIKLTETELGVFSDAHAELCEAAREFANWRQI